MRPELPSTRSSWDTASGCAIAINPNWKGSDRWYGEKVPGNVWNSMEIVRKPADKTSLRGLSAAAHPTPPEFRHCPAQLKTRGS
jgi:hypothetical protein